MVQFFKGDDLEKKFHSTVQPIASSIGVGLNSFFNQAYSCFILGDILYNTGRAPLSNAIAQDIFRSSFFTIFESFRVAGTFESYLEAFQNIFGTDVEVIFTVPAPGKLNIDITATSLELYSFISRWINDNHYVFDNIVDDELDQIVFQSFKGFESEFELNKMLFEMVPNGIYTQITLTAGA